MDGEQRFISGHRYIVDLFDVYNSISHRLREESGGGVFHSVVKTIMTDAVMYVFHGSQTHGERAIERILEKNLIGGLPGILITRLLFDSIYGALSIDGQHQLVGRYEYTLDSESWNLMIMHNPDYVPDRGSRLDKLNVALASGGWVSEKLRDTLDAKIF